MLKNGLLCFDITIGLRSVFILMKSKKRSLCIIFAVALVFSVLIELCLFTVNRSVEFPDGSVSLLNKEDCVLTPVGYNSNGNIYNQSSDDPQLIFTGVNETVKTIYIKFGSHITKDTPVQVYYAETATEFSASASKQMTATFPAKSAIMEIPGGDYSSLRIDIDGNFAIDDIIVSPSSAKTVLRFDGTFSIVHVLIFFAGISIALFIFVKWATGKKTEKSLTVFELIFLAACFVYYTMWIIKPLNYGPDEAMRYDVSLFFFNNNRLPVGTEAANPVWGFSYALLPTMLCNVLDYIPMKLASLFTANSFYILLAARMVSVCCATLTVYFTVKASKQIFKTPSRWIMITVIAAMPQFAFLGSYVNNDICSMLGISMILYAWTLAINENWNFKNALLLSVGMAVCAMSYYNSYVWVLASIFIYFITYFYHNKKDFKGFVKMSAFIVIITLVLMGYLFARHVYLYHDLLGFNVMHDYGLEYAKEGYKPGSRGTPSQHGYSLSFMLNDMGWISSSYQSFIGCFGPMAYPLSNSVYRFYKIFFAIAFIGFAFYLIKLAVKSKKKKPTLDWVMFYLALVACGVIAIALSVYNSYFSDYQPQGRYCFPMLPALAVFTAKGVEAFVTLLKSEKAQCAVVSSICTVLFMISVTSYTNVLLAS